LVRPRNTNTNLFSTWKTGPLSVPPDYFSPPRHVRPLFFEFDLYLLFHFPSSHFLFPGRLAGKRILLKQPAWNGSQPSRDGRCFFQPWRMRRAASSRWKLSFAVFGDETPADEALPIFPRLQVLLTRTASENLSLDKLVFFASLAVNILSQFSWPEGCERIPFFSPSIHFPQATQRVRPFTRKAEHSPSSTELPPPIQECAGCSLPNADDLKCCPSSMVSPPTSSLLSKVSFFQCRRDCPVTTTTTNQRFRFMRLAGPFSFHFAFDFHAMVSIKNAFLFLFAFGHHFFFSPSHFFFELIEVGHLPRSPQARNRWLYTRQRRSARRLLFLFFPSFLFLSERCGGQVFLFDTVFIFRLSVEPSSFFFALIPPPQAALREFVFQWYRTRNSHSG